MMKEKKSPYVLDGNKVAVRDAAGDILEMVENVLDRYGIHVPDEDQTLDENNACLYGMTYSLLMDSIASVSYTHLPDAGSLNRTRSGVTLPSVSVIEITCAGMLITGIHTYLLFGVLQKA